MRRITVFVLAAIAFGAYGGQPAAAQPASSLAPAAQMAPARLAPDLTLVPAAKGSPPVRVEIGAIKMDRKLLSVGLDKRNVPVVPKHDIGWYNLSAMPGQGENIVLWGHVLRFKNAPKIPAPFARLKELKKGSLITLYDKDGNAFTYQVTKQVRVTPDKVEYILPQGREMLTLVSCIGDKVVTTKGVEMTQRLITIAEPVE